MTKAAVFCQGGNYNINLSRLQGASVWSLEDFEKSIESKLESMQNRPSNQAVNCK